MSPQQIKRLRNALRLTQQNLADAIGARQHTVARWETGRNKPRGANLKALRELAATARKKREKHEIRASVRRAEQGKINR